MNEELKALAVQALTEVLDTAIQVKDFAVEQAPDVIKQLLAWHFTMSIIGFATAFVFLAIAFGFALYFNVKRPFPDSRSTEEEDKRGTNPRDIEWNNRGAAIIASLIGLFIAGISLVETEWIWLKILVAPKLYLIEYAASLVK